MTDEKSFIAVKPDGVQRGLVGRIITRFEDKGFKLVGLKMLIPSKNLLEEHYAELKEKPFFPRLINYMSSGPVVGMVWEGRNVVATGRKMMGATRPDQSAPGTIRFDYAIDCGKNVIHGSDSVETAKREIGIWFPEGTCEWTRCTNEWNYE